MSAQSPRGTQGSVAVGAVVVILIVAAVGTLGYYQFEVAKTITTTTSGPPTTAACTPATCIYVNITSGAGVPPSGYTQGQKTTFGFAPDTITVTVGQTVFWTNADSAAHTVTADNGAFNSGNMNSGDTFQFTFTTTGTYAYHCSYHSWMQGTVIVVAQGSTTTTSGATST